jgi:hypothetical protein
MTRSLKLKLVVVAVTGTLVGGAGFALASALPQPARSATGHSQAHERMAVPDGSQAEVHSAPVAGIPEAKGPDVTGSSRFGLCTAFASGRGGVNGKKTEAVPFRNLQGAAGAAGQSVPQFCADAAPHGAGAGHGRPAVGGRRGP